MTTTIIGVDCSTQQKKTGLALGLFEEEGARTAPLQKLCAFRAPRRAGIPFGPVRMRHGLPQRPKRIWGPSGWGMV